MNNNKKRRLQIIGKNMKTLRMNANMTQTELAMLLGVNFRTVSSYEKSVLLPRADVILKYCSFFSVRPDDLLGYEDFSGKKKIKCAEPSRNSREEVSTQNLLKEMNQLMMQLKKCCSCLYGEAKSCEKRKMPDALMMLDNEHGGQKNERNQC